MMPKSILKKLGKPLLITLLICIPIWVIRGCIIASNPHIDISEKQSVTVRVYNHRTSEIMILDLEEYLLGVVSAEMPISFSEEAIKAQAVAARTYTVKKLKQFGGTPTGPNGADITTDSGQCQAWESDEARRKKWGDSYAKNQAKLENAVYSTAGKIITYDGEAILAFFHSTSGGKTESSENAFSKSYPYLVSVVSEGEEDAPHYENDVTVKREYFASKINKEAPKAKLKASTLENTVKITERFESGRVESVKVGNVTLTGKTIRALFSLDSTNFSFKFTKTDVIIHTFGFGHGVGMSQIGANSMAKNGSDYIQILEHYYVGTHVQTLKSLE